MKYLQRREQKSFPTTIHPRRSHAAMKVSHADTQKTTTSIRISRHSPLVWMMPPATRTRPKEPRPCSALGDLILACTREQRE